MIARRLVIALFPLLLIVPAFAQDATPEATVEPTAEATADPNVMVAAPIADADATEDEFVAGAGTPILLIGLGAVLAVGGITLLRDNAKSKS